MAWEHLGKALLSLVDKYKRALQVVGAQQRKGSILVTVRIDALCHKAFCQRVSAYEMVGAVMVEDLDGRRPNSVSDISTCRREKHQTRPKNSRTINYRMSKADAGEKKDEVVM